MATAGHIAPDGAQRANELTRCEAADRRVVPGLWQLATRKGADLLCSRAQRFAESWVDCLPRCGHLVSRDAEFCGVRETIELRGVTKECAVATSTHIGNNTLDGGKHGIEGRTSTLFECAKCDFRLACTSPVGSNQLHCLRSIPSC